MRNLLSDDTYRTVFKAVLASGRCAHEAPSRLLYAAAAAAGVPARWRSVPTNYAADNRVVEILDGGDAAKSSSVPSSGWNRLPSLEGWVHALREQGIALGLLARGDESAEFFEKWQAPDTVIR